MTGPTAPDSSAPARENPNHKPATDAPEGVPSSTPNVGAGGADAGDQDIDTAGTEADDEQPSPLPPPARRSGSPRRPPASMADAPENQAAPIGPHAPASLHRREDDDWARAASPDFHDRLDNGSHQR
jgi:hypothetical protein